MRAMRKELHRKPNSAPADLGLRTVDSGLWTQDLVGPAPLFQPIRGVYLVVIRHSMFDVQRSMLNVFLRLPYLPRQWIYRR